MENIQMIKTADIIPHPNNPRKDLGDLTELTASIKKNGIMQNLTVVPEGGQYKALIGHRRLAAAMAAGVEEVPCKVVEDLTDNEQLAIMLEENMQRTDLTIMEQAKGFQMMLDLGDTVKTVAEKTGFSVTTIRHRVELAKLPEDKVTQKIDNHQLTIHDLFELEKVKDIEQRERILDLSFSSWNIQNRVETYLQDEKIKEAKSRLMPELKEEGITRKKGFATYNNTYQELAHYDLLHLDVEEGLKIPVPQKGETFYWDIPYGDVLYIFTVNNRKVAAQEREKKKEEERKRKADELEHIYNAVCEETRRFIVALLKGDYTIKKADELKDWSDLWEYVFDQMFNTFCYFRSDYEDVFDGETETVEPSEVTALEQAIVVAWNYASDRSVITYYGSYNEERAEIMKAVIRVLERCGFSLTAEQGQAVLDGTHKNYTRSK